MSERRLSEHDRSTYTEYYVTHSTGSWTIIRVTKPGFVEWREMKTTRVRV